MALPPMRWIRRSLVLALLLPALSSPAQTVPEYELKAAMVYNFVLFTEWPADTPFEADVLNICVGPDSALRRPLLGLSERSVRGRRIAVHSLAAGGDARTCQVVFIDGAYKERWTHFRKGWGSGVLTISDDDDADRGSVVIALATEDNRIVFDIDTRAARQARLVLSSKLLRLARTVQ